MAFYHRDGEHWVPTPTTRGPWHHEQQHGGPPAALLTGVLQRGAPAGFHLTRFTAELLRPVPLAPLTVTLGPFAGGRSVQRAEATLHHEGRAVLLARGLFARHLDLEPGPPGPDVPAPSEVPRWLFPFFPWDEGFHQAIDTRVVQGAWPHSPLTCWVQLLHDIVDGEPTTAEQRVVAIADAQSGLAPPTDLERFTFVNPDLTVAFARPPRGAWHGLRVQGFSGGRGAGLAEASLFDVDGMVGRSVQTVLVAPRTRP